LSRHFPGCTFTFACLKPIDFGLTKTIGTEFEHGILDVFCNVVDDCCYPCSPALLQPWRPPID
jgi:hypothetical protein